MRDAMQRKSRSSNTSKHACSWNISLASKGAVRSVCTHTRNRCSERVSIKLEKDEPEYKHFLLSGRHEDFFTLPALTKRCCRLRPVESSRPTGRQTTRESHRPIGGACGTRFPRASRS